MRRRRAVSIKFLCLWGHFLWGSSSGDALCCDIFTKTVFTGTIALLLFALLLGYCLFCGISSVAWVDNSDIELMSMVVKRRLAADFEIITCSTTGVEMRHGMYSSWNCILAFRHQCFRYLHDLPEGFNIKNSSPVHRIPFAGLCLTISCLCFSLRCCGLEPVFILVLATFDLLRA